MNANAKFHEDFTREEELKGSSDRVFGLVFGAAFAIIGLVPILGGHEPRLWAILVAAVFIFCATVRPEILRPLNRLWQKIGLSLHRIVNPLVMGVLFYAIITPMAVVMRLRGKDPLRLKRPPGVSSYWIPRTPPGPPPDSMTNQF